MQKPTGKKKEKPAQPSLVVGVGASAGGVEALQALFGCLEPSDMSFIVLLHVDPAADPLLAKGLSQTAKMPVQEAVNGAKLEPGQIYVVPGHHTVQLKNGVIELVPLERVEERRDLIDKLFFSLARDQGERSVAIVLSGTGSDGSTGLKAVSKAGGMTLVQAPSTAAHEEMPQTAIDTGLVDHVLYPQAISEELVAYSQHMQLAGEKEGFQELHAAVDKHLPQICDILVQATGHNFRHYKISTLSRRIQRRIQVMRIVSVQEYVKLLRNDPVEANKLFNDLLIGVTAFFRDGEAFESLASEVLVKLFKDRKADQPIRIWVPGCATGEEAYTIAMLCLERLEKIDNPPEVLIFATDIDEPALTTARQGSYPMSITEEVSPERLKKFFVKKGQQYHVIKDLRSMVLFSAHNLINDPPFSRLDLISCRNLLIYLGSHLQKKLIPLFHYALKPGGYLFLGPSENLSSHRELFRPINVKYRISQRLPTAVEAPVMLSRNSSPTLVKPPNVATTPETDTYLIMQRIILDEFAPKALVVDEEGQIVCASGNLEKYLTVSAGTFHNSATRLVREGLRVGLRTALAEAIRVRRKVVHDSVSLRTDDGFERISITVQPMPHLGDEAGLYLVVFQSMGQIMKEEAGKQQDAGDAAALIEYLERELLSTREDLERTVQDLEAANEEMKSSNEELLSMNEELQSANEELETSKEEVQAANDNLSSVNMDLENLLASTQIATIFLDDSMNVRRVTPSATAVYNILPSDTGRSLTDFTHKAKSMPPMPSLASVNAKGFVEHEVEMQNGSWYIRRVLPYRTHEGTPEGIVVMFTDITQRKLSELALIDSQERLRLAISAANLGDWRWEPEDDRIILSPRAAEIFGVKIGDYITRSDMRDTLVVEEDRELTLQALKKAVSEKGDYVAEYRVNRPDGELVWVQATGRGEYDSEGNLISMIGVVKDITERRTAEEKLRASEQLYRSIGESIDYGVWVCDAEGRNIYASDSFLKLVGMTQEQCSEFGWSRVLHPDDVESTIAEWKECVRTGKIWDKEHRYKGVDGKWHPALARGIPVRDRDGKITRWVGINLDISTLKLAQEALKEADRRKDEFLATLAHELRNPLAPISNGLQIMRRALDKPELLNKTQTLMERQVTHIVRLVDDLLDVSRITRGQIELHKEKIELSRVVQMAVELSDQLIAERGHKLKLVMPDKPVTLSCDPTRISQVIANLLNNAAKYTPNKGEIEFKAEQKGEELILTVSDNGIGIPESMHGKIFDMFVQVDTALERSQGGLGIGLTLVRNLVSLHGGTVNVALNPSGKGSQFTVILPIIA